MSQSVEEFLNGYAPEVREIALRLRTWIRDVAPDAEEKVYPGWKNIGYKQNKIFCAIAPFKNAVNLYFRQGTHLHDSQGLLTGSGKEMRHLKIKKMQELHADYVQDLMKQALELDGRDA